MKSYCSRGNTVGFYLYQKKGYLKVITVVNQARSLHQVIGGYIQEWLQRGCSLEFFKRQEENGGRRRWAIRFIFRNTKCQEVRGSHFHFCCSFACIFCIINKLQNLKRPLEVMSKDYSQLLKPQLIFFLPPADEQKYYCCSWGVTQHIVCITFFKTLLSFLYCIIYLSLSLITIIKTVPWYRQKLQKV